MTCNSLCHVRSCFVFTCSPAIDQINSVGNTAEKEKQNHISYMPIYAGPPKNVWVLSWLTLHPSTTKKYEIYLNIHLFISDDVKIVNLVPSLAKEEQTKFQFWLKNTWIVPRLSAPSSAIFMQKLSISSSQNYNLVCDVNNYNPSLSEQHKMSVVLS